jgi:hypothetical protein
MAIEIAPVCKDRFVRCIPNMVFIISALRSVRCRRDEEVAIDQRRYTCIFLSTLNLIFAFDWPFSA